MTENNSKLDSHAHLLALILSEGKERPSTRAARYPATSSVKDIIENADAMWEDRQNPPTPDASSAELDQQQRLEKMKAAWS